MTVIPLLKICKCYNVSTKIINANKAAKVGIVGIKGTLYDGYIDENRSTSCWKNNEGNVKGTADNAEIVIKPTSDINSIKSALNNMNPDKKVILQIFKRELDLQIIASLTR